ncbi:hypothetical protein FNV43_RR22209 [Rhamnella rubrinervis]|uniref:Uncharacterized protein n=1 Tax=Rhamnella rubrinervis TaxID=2594499 RepID=A0A8K0DPS8_9ROSA|nr:hypothetical protein FNV43_RR22209 [Rhamnella rubrinervis]
MVVLQIPRLDFLSKAAILDLSHNKFSGNLPTKLFENLRATTETDTEKGLEYMRDVLSYYQDSVSVQMKGHLFQLERILTIFTTIDLSSNNFEGEIPQSIGKLKALKVLNISDNKLNDWSDAFLLARNFTHNSYGGNLDLCGPPLSKLCSNDLQPPSSPNFEHEGDEDEQTNGIDWMIVLIGFGCGMVIGTSVGYTMLSEKRIARLMRWIGGERLCKLLKRFMNKAR